MPRISISQREKRCAEVRDRVELYRIRRRRESPGISCKEIAAALGMDYQTYLRRMKSPDKFTLGELLTIANTMNIALRTLLGEEE